MVRTILDATIAEFARCGYAGLRIEEVAARAGVNKTTVYRRWPTKAALLGDAVRSMQSVGGDPPDTGELTGDLLALARRFVHDASRAEGVLVVRMLTSDVDTPEVRALTYALRGEFEAVWHAAIARAVARAELPQGTSADLITRTIGSTLLQRVCAEGPVDDAWVVAVVELVVRGARAGGAVLRRTRRSRGA